MIQRQSDHQEPRPWHLLQKGETLEYLRVEATAGLTAAEVEPRHRPEVQQMMIIEPFHREPRLLVFSMNGMKIIYLSRLPRSLIYTS